MNKIIVLILILFCNVANAEEFISGFDEEKDLVVLNDALRKIDAKLKQALLLNYAIDSQSTDAYKISLTPAPTEYKDGMEVFFKANTANTGACSLNVNNLGAKSLKSLHDQDPADNYIESGSTVQVIYDGTNFQILSPDNNP